MIIHTDSLILPSHSRFYMIIHIQSLDQSIGETNQLYSKQRGIETCFNE
ncbi:MAG: hypothetical protein K0R67_1629 [Paenibacillus sp.]|nr:hypothetical protein [Paenibacillus sp.]